MTHQEIGKKIKEARKRKGLTQVELGKLIGRDSGTISEIERGLHRAGSKKVLNDIAKALGVRFGLDFPY